MKKFNESVKTIKIKINLIFSTIHIGYVRASGSEKNEYIIKPNKLHLYETQLRQGENKAGNISVLMLKNYKFIQ